MRVFGLDIKETHHLPQFVKWYNSYMYNTSGETNGWEWMSESKILDRQR